MRRMASPEGIPPTPAQKSLFYRRISALAIETGERLSRGHFSVLNRVPMAAMPDIVRGRFPPGLEDMTGYFRLRTVSSEEPGLRYAIVGQLDFERSAPPSDPADRGFRQNKWLVQYLVTGDSVEALNLGVSLRGKRQYAFPPDDPPQGTEKEQREALLRDMFVDERTIRLRPPRSMDQPPLWASEVGKLIGFVELSLDDTRARWEPDPPIRPGDAQ